MQIEEGKTRRRAERLEVRVTSETKDLCQKAASLEGRSLTDFLVSSVVEAAKRSIRENEFLELSLRDRTAFVTALLNPAPAPNARLREAALRHETQLWNR
jgi:uncharacterized protein (DUF1778 family)